MRKFILNILLAIIPLCPVCLHAAGLATSVYLSANPDAIIADGKSVTTISAEIRDTSGDIVPDGTLVSFSTNLGTIETNVATTAGIARARLTSGTATGSALVSAWITQGGAAGHARVEFLAPGTEIPRQSFVTISSDNYLVFDPANMTIYASGNVRVFHRGLTIRTYEAEYNVQMGTIKCRRQVDGEPIMLSRGDRSQQASLFYYQVKDMKGNAVVEGASGSLDKVAVRGADLEISSEQEGTPDTIFDFKTPAESSIMVKADSITVRPGTDIQFRRAQIYVDGNRALSVPLHVVSLKNARSLGSQYFGWGTNGLRVDLPFYYSLSPSSTGSIHIRRGQQAGWGFYSSNSGWSTDLVQDYTTGSGGDGTFIVNRILSGDWGAHWQHNQVYDSGSRIYSYLDFPDHRDLFGMINLSKPLSRGNLGLNLYGNRYQDQSGSISSDLYIQSLPKPIAGGSVNYVMLARTSFAGGGGIVNDGMGAGLQMQLFGKPIQLGKRTNLTSSMSIGEDWGKSRSGFSLLGNVSLSHRLGPSGTLGNLGLIYSYTRDPSYTTQFGHHRLSASLFYAPSEQWHARFYSTYTLDASLSSTFADVSYQFLPGWRLNVLQTLQRSELQTIDGINKYSYSDTEIAVGKEVGDYEIMLVWSKSWGRLRLEFNLSRF